MFWFGLCRVTVGVGGRYGYLIERLTLVYVTRVLRKTFSSHSLTQELDGLEYPKCAASAKRQRATWDKLHANLVEQCPEGAGRAISRDDLVWALECVLSRAFNGRFGGGQNVRETPASTRISCDAYIAVLCTKSGGGSTGRAGCVFALFASLSCCSPGWLGAL